VLPFALPFHRPLRHRSSSRSSPAITIVVVARGAIAIIAIFSPDAPLSSSLLSSPDAPSPSSSRSSYVAPSPSLRHANDCCAAAIIVVITGRTVEMTVDWLEEGRFLLWDAAVWRVEGCGLEMES
jgi:hypothetical protein